LAGKKPALQKSRFCFDHVNRHCICGSSLNNTVLAFTINKKKKYCFSFHALNEISQDYSKIYFIALTAKAFDLFISPSSLTGNIAQVLGFSTKLRVAFYANRKSNLSLFVLVLVI